MKQTLCFDKDISSEVYKYIDKITADLNEHRKDVYSFKEDLKLSIIVTMEELVANGYTIEDALKSAVSKCENDEFVKREILNLKQNTKKSQKIYFKIACASLIISLLLLIAAYFHYLVISDFELSLKSYPSLSDTLGSNDYLITEDMKSSLKNLVDSKWFAEAGAFFISDAAHSKEIPDNFAYTYTSGKGRIDSEFFSGKKSDFLFSYHIYHNSVSIPGTAKTVNAIFRYKNFGYGVFIMAFIIFLTYWITFALWARLNILYAEYGRRWILLVFLTNILGYLIFEYKLNNDRNNFPLIKL